MASKYDKLVSAAHDFLSLEGYINFGVAPTFQITPDPTPSPSSPKASVLVIGAGLAGLAAARQLLHFGYKVCYTLSIIYLIASGTKMETKETGDT